MPENQPQVDAVFHEALRRAPGADRAAYLDDACGKDQDVRRRVERLLRAASEAGSFLEAPAHDSAPTADQAPVERPGAVIGPYKLVEQIGEGGMGAVWMAQQTDPVRRLVAVKLIKAGMDTKQVVARFEAERQALALMDHPNIATVLDGGTTTAGRPYFVMDLVRGVPITNYCDDHRLTPRQRLELFVPVCQAVQHAHQKGVIHRDLKPSNVLVALYDGKPVPKVIDFGVAKAAGHPLTDKTLVTGFGAIVGTLEYMSPEQAEVNQLDIDTRSDVFSLGVLLYELLTGTTPFTRKGLEWAGVLEMLRLIREQEPTRPSTMLSTAEGLPTLAANRGTEPAKLTKLVRGELDWIVMKALEKDRTRRYETATALAADLGRYLADESVQACPPSAGYRLRKFARRNTAGLATVGVVLFLLVLLGGGVGWVLRDRSIRGAATAHLVEHALGESQALSQEGKLHEAVLAANKGQALLQAGQDSHDLRRRVTDLLTELDLAQELEEARLSGIRLGEGSPFDHEITVRGYAEALRGHGIDLERLTPAAAAARIRHRGISGHLTFALDHWASLPGVVPEPKERLRTIVAAVDPNAWRNELRTAAQADPTRLKKLAASAELHEQSPMSLTLLASHLLRHGETETAVAVLENAQRRYPSDFWVTQHLANCFACSQPPRWQQAIRYLTAGVAIRPRSPGARLKLGWALQRQGWLDEARTAYEAAIALKPDYAIAHLHLGHLLHQRRDYEGAVGHFSRGLELRPGYWECLVCRAGAHVRLKRWAEAVADGNEAVRLAPEKPNTWFARAEAYHGMGQRDRAIADYTRVLTLRPDHGLSKTRRGELLREAEGLLKNE